jgi:hypothetical protein
MKNTLTQYKAYVLIAICTVSSTQLRKIGPNDERGDQTDRQFEIKMEIRANHRLGLRNRKWEI